MLKLAGEAQEHPVPGLERVGALAPPIDLDACVALLTQPAISALIGWFAYRETLSLTDGIGAVAIAAALVLVRLPERGLRQVIVQPS